MATPRPKSTHYLEIKCGHQWNPELGYPSREAAERAARSWEAEGHTTRIVK